RRRRDPRGAAAAGRRPAHRRAARRGDRKEPRLQRRRPRARLVRSDAFPHALIPRALRDSEPEDHRPPPRGRRPLRARSPANMTTLFANAYVVTMDDAGSEHERGWILVDDGLIRAIGSGAGPEADAVQNLDGAIVTPGLVNTHHHLWQNLTRARAQEENLF